METLIDGEVQTSNFHFKLDGPAVEEHEIDVSDLAPVLVSMGELLQSANSVLNGDESKLSVKVKATNGGSFEIDFTAVHEHASEKIEPVLDFAKDHSESITAAKELVELIFLSGSVVGGGAAGLFYLLKYLKGRKVESKSIDPETQDIQITIEDLTITVDPRAYKLAESTEVRKNAAKVVSVLEKQGIESIEIARNDDYMDSIKLLEADIRSFEVPPFEERELSSDTRKMHLQITSLSFKEENSWRVTEGSEQFWVSIADIEFLQKIAFNQVSFAKGDILTCIVEETQSTISKGELKMTRIVTEVIDHRKGQAQLPLI